MVRTSDLQVNSLALYLLSYEGRFENFHKRLFPKCSYCGGENSRRHIVEECQEGKWIELREELRRKLKEVMGEEEEERIERSKGLELLLLEVYFSPQVDWDVNAVLNLLKWYCTAFYLQRKDDVM